MLFFNRCLIQCLFFAHAFLICSDEIKEENFEKYSFLHLETIAESIKGNPEIAQDKQIEISGFLYQSPEHGWVLASEPNLKSCCVGNDKQKNKQLLVEGKMKGLPSSATAIALRGVLVVDLNNYFPYKLKDAEGVSQEKKLADLWLTVAVIGLLLLGSININKFFKTN